MKQHIPNTLTLVNLLCGALACYSAVQWTFEMSYCLFIACLVLDFLDGFTARLLHAKSEIGKQLDSLADLVAFGVFPAFLMAQTITTHWPNNGAPLEIIGILKVAPVFIFAACAAWRLAKFNITPAKNYFSGLPTPAAAVAVVGLHFCIITLLSETMYTPRMLWAAHTIVLFFGLQMAGSFTLFSLKFAHLKWQGNQMRYVFIIVSAILLVWLNFVALLPIVFLYIVWSVISNKIWKWSSQPS